MFSMMEHKVMNISRQIGFKDGQSLFCDKFSPLRIILKPDILVELFLNLTF